MKNRQAIVFGLAAGLVVVVLVFGVAYELRDADKPLIETVKLPPADYGQPPSADGSGLGSSSRPPAAAGQFYPNDRQELAGLLDTLLAEAQDRYQPASAADSQPYIVIVPHAGYQYSGPIAAAAIAQLADRDFTRVVLIGHSHSQQFSDGVVVDGHDNWRTPLGTVGLDKGFIQRLSADSGIIRQDKRVHQEEHSLEVVVPWLQRSLPTGFRIVPLLFGDNDRSLADKLAKSLYRLNDRHTAVVISTDLSHYSSPAEAERLDRMTAEAWLSGDAEAWHRLTSVAPPSSEKEVTTLACAAIAVETGMRLAERYGWVSEKLAYANTADMVPESSARSVGYLAGVYWGNWPTEWPDLTETEGSRAVSLARQGISSLFAEDSSRTAVPASGQTAFDQRRGVFVTLKLDGRLRGCVGQLQPNQPLDMAIREMAQAAAARDSRFSPLSQEELAGLQLTVSVLSPLKPISQPEQIELGRHGVQLISGLNSGVFLPEVGQEQDWSRQEFLEELCSQKAGLPRDCWQQPETTLQVFTAQTFTEPFMTAAAPAVSR